MGTYTCDPSDQEAEVGRWPQVQGQPRLHRRLCLKYQGFLTVTRVGLYTRNQECVLEYYICETVILPSEALCFRPRVSSKSVAIFSAAAFSGHGE